MKLHMVYVTLSEESQARLGRLFAAAPVDIRPASLYSPVIMTSMEPRLTEEDKRRTFEVDPSGFAYPYSAVTGQTLLIIKLVSPQLDEYYLELKAKYGGFRSYFGSDVDYPYLLVGTGNDLNNTQRGWISNMGTTLQRSSESFILTNATVGVGEL